MNESQESHGPTPHGWNDPVQPAQPKSSAAGFFSWLRELGMQRSSTERWFTGVSGGIAAKAGIDPLIVRGIFVVLALLGGPGLLLYVAGWLLLPDEQGKIHTEELFRSRATPAAVAGFVIIGLWLLGALIAGINFPSIRWNIWGIFGFPNWMSTTFQLVFWLLVLSGVGFLINRIILEHGRRKAYEESESYGYTPHTQASPAEEHKDPRNGSESVTEQFNSWSAKYAQQHEEQKLGVPHVLISAALALITAGVTALILHNSTPAITSTHINPILTGALIAATTIFALSMIIAGLRGKNSGPVGLLGIVGVVSIATSAVLPLGTSYHLIGLNSVTESAPATFSVVGNTEIDLSIYDADLENSYVEINQLVGNIELRVPKTRPMEITMDVAAGQIEPEGFEWKKQSGVLTRRTVVVNEHAPGETLHVHARVLAGNITLIK